MLLPKKYSFRLVSRKKLFPVERVSQEDQIASDSNKRLFLKLAGLAGVGLFASTILPKKASAYVMGNTPTSNVVGLKNSSNTRINPATEDSLLSVISGQGVTKLTLNLTGTGSIHTPASGKKCVFIANAFP